MRAEDIDKVIEFANTQLRQPLLPWQEQLMRRMLAEPADPVTLAGSDTSRYDFPCGNEGVHEEHFHDFGVRCLGVQPEPVDLGTPHTHTPKERNAMSVTATMAHLGEMHNLKMSETSLVQIAYATQIHFQMHAGDMFAERFGPT